MVSVPYFRPLFHRLIERIKSLVENFSADAAPFDIRALRDAADGVALVEDHTHWLDLEGYSTRLRRPRPAATDHRRIIRSARPGHRRRGVPNGGAGRPA